MAMSLNDWHKRLETRFKALAEIRQKSSLNEPVFAFEHGLKTSDRDLLKEAIRENATGKYFNENYWLPWVIYATEIGYQYSGHEYWPVFENSTPGWSSYNRDFIREAFIKFRDNFGGYEPQGIWAKHFTIISWPISHAIAPKDLQQQLVSALHEISNSINYEDLDNATELGRLIHSRSLTRSNRFREFSSEITLVGQLVRALLSDQATANNTTISHETLSRLSTDLRSEQQTQQWLDSALQNAANIRRRGLRSAIRRKVSNPSAGEGKRSHEVSIQVELQLIKARNDEWDVYVQTNDPSELVIAHPEIGTILSESKSYLFGSTSNVLPRGRLINGSITTRLNKWPNPNDKPVTLHPVDKKFENLEDVEKLFSHRKHQASEPRWLFEQSGATATFTSNKSARAGRKYILIVREGTTLDTPSNHFREITVNCSGVKAFELDLTDQISSATENDISASGISVQRDIILEPVGYGPSSSDSFAGSIWDLRDTPTFQISSNHILSSIELEDVQSSDTEKIDITSDQQDTFFELNDLEIGEHEFKLTLFTDDPTSEPVVNKFNVTIVNTRGPSSRERGMPIELICDPPSPSIDSLFDGSAEMSLQLAKGQNASLKFELFTEYSTTPSITKRDISVQGCGDTFNVQKLLQSKLQAVPEFTQNLDAATSLRMTIDSDEWGIIVKDFERDFSPLRWSVTPSSTGRKLNLLDQGSSSEQVVINYAGFSNPDDLYTIKEPVIETISDFGEPGGLYQAQKGEFEDILVLPGPHPADGSAFASMLATANKNPTNAMRIWSQARVTADSDTQKRRDDVLRDLTSKTFVSLCGEDWHVVESEVYDSNTNVLEIIDSATGLVDFEFQNSLDKQIETTAEQLTETRLNNFAYVSEAELKTSQEQSEFALRLASDVNAAYSFANDRFEQLLAQIPGELLRRARLLSLTVGYMNGYPKFSTSKLPGWDWR